MEMNKPNIRVEDTFSTSISNFREKTKSKLEKSLPEVIKAENSYDREASNGTLSNIRVNDLTNTYATRDEFVKVYTDKFVKKDHLARNYYDKIMLIAHLGKCPYCGQRNVSTLDHYLDKKKYPKYTVTPYNLIPSCSDCNKTKLSDNPEESGKYYVHPYYDKVDQFSWLKAKVFYKKPLVVEFYIERNDEIETETMNRICYHFSKLNLRLLYSIEAINELNNKTFRLENLFKEQGNESVRKYLYDEYLSYRNNNLNSWQTALFKILSEDENFYSNILKWL